MLAGENFALRDDSYSLASPHQTGATSYYNSQGSNTNLSGDGPVAPGMGLFLVPPQK